MQDKTKNIIITISFFIILIVTFITNILLKDKTISIAERRKLAQFPQITIEKIKDGEASKNLEKYVTDQFIARDFLRQIKSFISIDILKQKDNNKLFEKDESIYKMEYPLNKENLQKSLNKINKIYNKYLQGMDVYYAIIPDKNYYLKNDDHLKIDYQELLQISKQKLDKMKYIDIWESLTLEDYYRTDLHWKQENLNNVLSTIQNNMNLTNTSRNKLQNK